MPREPLGPSGRRTGVALSEIHYHPAARADALNLEFIELYNSNPFIEDISGWQIKGDIQFTFPTNTVMQGNTFLVVAAAPADISTAYGIGGVLGPWTGSLPNGSGQIQVLKRSGGIVLDVTYGTQPPWPLASDGLGPSLVLSRPTYGEANPVAWSASTRLGGSPGTNDPAPFGPLESVAFSEVLAQPGFGQAAFVELHNRGTVSADLSGAWIGVSSATNLYRIPDGTRLDPGAFLSVGMESLGFEPAPAGDRLLLYESSLTRILDVLPVRPEEPGISIGRQPEGVEGVRSLESPTPGGRNAPVFIRSVAINEIFYNPPSGNSDEEFIELYNWTLQPVDLAGWRVTDGIEFTFPAGATLPPGGFVVLSRNPAVLNALQGPFNSGVLYGPYSGSLSDNGEHLALQKPEWVSVAGKAVVAWVTVDDVTYGHGGKWGRWSDGGGSSLELVNPWSDHLLPTSWADSDETGKAPWTVVEATGFNDMVHPSTPTTDELQIMLWGAGEMLVDNVEVLVNGQNRIRNAGFETNAVSWGGQGTHRPTFWETNSGFESSRCLHIVAVDRGDNDANRVHGSINPVIQTNNFVTLRARVRWLAGEPQLLMRLRGGGVEAEGRAVVPSRLGTPGRPNSRARSNLGPAIREVAHFPVLPATNQPIRVTARVSDPDRVGAVVLKYRIDPTNTLFSVTMVDDGTGADEQAGDHLYTAVIPGQKIGKLVAFRVEATDLAVVPSTSVFPAAAPRSECLVRVGETNVIGGFGTYRFWITQSNVVAWSNREKMSNEPLDVTYVYGTNRVVYGAGAHYSGSNYTVGGYDTPTGSLCGYDLFFPLDDLVLGEQHFVLDWPIRDDTDQREQLMWWLLEQYGLPNHYRRYVNLYVNGVKRGIIYDDVQQPDGNELREWFPTDSQGSLLKTDCWDEFADSGDAIAGLNCVLNTLEQFLTADGAKKTSRYRWNWRPRASDGPANGFADLFTLVDAVTYPDPAGFVAATTAVTDMEHWMRTFAMNDLAAFWDAFGNPNAKNTYLYKPKHSGWKLICWDFDVGMGINFNDDPTAPLFDVVGDPAINRIYATPQLLRPYWVAMDEAVNSFFIAGTGTAVDAILNSKYAAFRTNRIALADPSPIKSWINQRRSFITNQIRRVSAPFAITTQGGQGFEVASNRVTLAGTAPASLQGIQVNGHPRPVTWTTISNWACNVVLQPGDNMLVVDGLTRRGTSVEGSPRQINVRYTGVGEGPEAYLRITEVLFRPLVAGTGFVEIHNRSSTLSFDLSGWRLDGVKFVFPEGTVIGPGAFLLVVADRVAFGQAYGWTLPVAGEFPGSLRPEGEIVSLVRPASGTSPELVVDSLYYDPAVPWYAAAPGTGTSIERLDDSRDALRAGNWQSLPDAVSLAEIPLVPVGSTWRYDDSGTDLGTAWRQPGYDDSGWSTGAGGFYSFTNALPFPRTTLLRMTNADVGRRVFTHYFRTTFVVPEVPPGAQLRFGLSIDDGTVFYLNGQEVLRRRLPSGLIEMKTLANSDVPNATLEAPYFYTASALVPGTNLLAVEVHQSKTNSPDMAMAVWLTLVPSPLAGSTPGGTNRASESLPPWPAVWLSEVAPLNLAGPRDSGGQLDPWVELYNAGPDTADLSGWSLTDDVTQPARWTFPAGTLLPAGAYRLVWVDGDAAQSTASELHASFRIAAEQGSLLLGRPVGGEVQWIDYLVYGGLAPGESYGRLPADAPAGARSFYAPTPGAANNPARKPVVVAINEWMASNTSTVPDPADGNFDDWFELYNASDETADLSGYTLTGNLASPADYVIPDGVTLAPRGFLRVWADQQTSQTRVGGDLHASFKLSAKGDSIGLFTPEGVRVDAVTFGAQKADISQGRLPDGPGGVVVFMKNPTPGAPNTAGDPPTAPIAILDAVQDVDGGLTLTWESSAGVVYRLEMAAQIPDGPWEPVAGDVTASGIRSSKRDPDPRAAGRRFYRVIQVR